MIFPSVTKLLQKLSRLGFHMGIPCGSAVQNPHVMQEMQEDPLEEGMAIHSNIPAWRIPWTEEPGGLQSIRLQRVRHD